MEEDIPKDVTTNTNDENSDNLNPDSETPWKSNPLKTTNPKITVVLPEDATITEVTLKKPENVEDFTVIIIDKDNTTTSVNYIIYKHQLQIWRHV